MADLLKELNSLDFSTYIGGPMLAAIDAQNSAAIAEINFIKNVCFKNGELLSVPFKYEKTVLKEDGTTDFRPYTLNVPLISIVSIPVFRVEEMNIDFRAKLTSCETIEVETEEEDLNQNQGSQRTLSAFSSTLSRTPMVALKAAPSYKRNSRTGAEINRAYDFSVQVKIVNDEIPAGLDRVLRILENEITELKE